MVSGRRGGGGRTDHPPLRPAGWWGGTAGRHRCSVVRGGSACLDHCYAMLLHTLWPLISDFSPWIRESRRSTFFLALRLDRV